MHGQNHIKFVVRLYSLYVALFYSMSLEFLENRIDKVISTAIPGEIWRPTSAQQVQHLGLVEENGNQYPH